MPIVHIRLLKVTLLPHPSDKFHSNLTCVVTLTSDLGESSHPHETPLAIRLTRAGTTIESIVKWTGTRIVEKYTFLVPTRVPAANFANDLLARTKDWNISFQFTSTTVSKKRRLNGSLPEDGFIPQHLSKFINIQGQKSIIGLNTTLESEKFLRSVSRRFLATDGAEFTILEETQESIVSHLWDSGVLLSSLISSEATGPLIAILRDTLGKADTVLELGAGTGIVGITIAKCYHGVRGSRKELEPGAPYSLEVLLTDLPAAQGLITKALIQNDLGRSISFHPLDWTLPVPPIHNFNVNENRVIVMADVIYNDAMHDALYETLDSLTGPPQDSKSYGAVKLVFMSKYRHSSERPFIDRLKSGYVVDFYAIIDGHTFEEKDMKYGEEPQCVNIGDFEFLVLSN